MSITVSLMEEETCKVLKKNGKNVEELMEEWRDKENKAKILEGKEAKELMEKLAKTKVTLEGKKISSKEMWSEGRTVILLGRHCG